MTTQQNYQSDSVTSATERVLVPEGPAVLGAEYPGEGPALSVHIPDFLIGKFTVSNAEFAEFVAAGAYRHPEFWDPEGYDWLLANGIDCPAYWQDEEFNAPEQPVTGVSYYESAAYAAWVGTRLPYEVEWEKAARGVDGRRYPWGDDREVDLAIANYAPDFVPVTSAPVPVDQFPENKSPYGCRQMAGNVFEWCSDYYHTDTPQRRTQGQLVERRASGRRVLKGGAWHTGAGRLRASARWSFTPELRDNVVGFRLVYNASEL